MARTILLLEDDPLFNETLQDLLEEEGYELATARDPLTALDLTYSHHFDLYLFDVNLPFESGFDLLEKLRQSGDTTPTIFLTSREDKASLTQGFDVGADDYLRKPVDLDELLLRIRAVLRRQLRDEQLTLGPYHLDTVAKELWRDGERIEVSHKAMALLLMLVEANSTVVSSDAIKEQLWAASESPSEGALRVYISQIKKLFPEALVNVRGIGYRFDLGKVDQATQRKSQ